MGMDAFIAMMDEFIATAVVVVVLAPLLGFMAKALGEFVAKRNLKDIWKGKF